MVIPGARYALLAIGLTVAGSSGNYMPEGPSLKRIAVFKSARPAAEILSLQKSSRLGVLSHSEDGQVELIDFSDPEKPRSLELFDLDLEEGEELTSVAVHPTHAWFLTSIKGGRALQPGRVQAHSLTDGSILASIPAGFGPDCVAIAPDGLHALIANEGEGYVEKGGRRVSPPGSVTWLKLTADPDAFVVRQIALPTVEAIGAVVASDRRFLKRRVGGKEVEIPITANTPDCLEPEVIAYSPSQHLAFCTLQENNAVAVIDVVGARITRIVGLGLTRHGADLTHDGKYEADQFLVALREPDGIAVLPGGNYFVTADEGDTGPGPSEAEEGKPCGGGRTVSVFDVGTGRCVGDTGGELDRWCAAAGIYPDERSDNKGCEPEMITAFEIDGKPFAAVGLERAGAVALIDLAAPSTPKVVSLAAVGEDANSFEPEGIVHFHDDRLDAHYIYTANEGNGTITVLRVER